MDLLASLPTEISQYILSFLSPNELSNCSAVSKHWRSLCDYSSLWRQHCEARGWLNKDFIDENRTHTSQSILDQVLSGPLRQINDWALNYHFLTRLPNSWMAGSCTTYKLNAHDASVSCFHSDGYLLAIGHTDGVISILNIRKLPTLVNIFTPILKGYKIISIRISKSYLVVLQSMLLQLYKFDDTKNIYILTEAKSFELGFSNIEVLQRYKISNNISFENWYKNKIGSDKYTKEKILNIIHFSLQNSLIYVGVRDYQMIYVWSLTNGKRSDTIHVPNHMGKLRDMILNENRIYIIYASRNIRHITVYDIIKKEFLFEVTTIEYKTQKLLIEQFLLGVSVSGVGLTTPGILTVWNKDTGNVISIRKTQYLSFKTVAVSWGFVIYGEGTTIFVWEPINDHLLTSFSIDESIIFISPTFHTFLIVCTHQNCWLIDWLQRVKLYRTVRHRQKSGDYRDLVYYDETMLLILGDTKTVEMICYC